MALFGQDSLAKEGAVSAPKMRLAPIGFWSYARQDDELSNGELTHLRTQVRSILQQQFGRTPIEIFQDTSAIPHGAKWEEEIRHSLFNATFFIPILTPNFLQSEWCCREVQLFLERQQQLYDTYPDLPRESRIFPILYVDVHRADTVDPSGAATLATLQAFDFRELQYDTGPIVRKAIAGFATSIRDMLLMEVARPLSEAEAAQLRAEREAAHAAEESERQRRSAEAALAAANRIETARLAEEQSERDRAIAAAEAAARRQRISEKNAGRRAAEAERRAAQIRERAAKWAAMRRFITKRWLLAVAAVAAAVAALVASQLRFAPAGPPPTAPSPTIAAKTPVPARPEPAAYAWLLGTWGLNGDCGKRMVITDALTAKGAVTIDYGGEVYGGLAKPGSGGGGVEIDVNQFRFLKDGDRVKVIEDPARYWLGKCGS